MVDARRAALLLTSVGAGVSTLAAQAPAPAVIEFTIPRAGNFPHDPAVAADGIVWYTDQTNSYIGRLDPATGKITDFADAHAGFRAARHRRRARRVRLVHCAAHRAPRPGQPEGRLDRGVRPARRGAQPAHADRAPGGGLVHRREQQQLRPVRPPHREDGRLDRSTPNSIPYGMYAAPDGSVWIAHLGANELGRVDPVSGQLTGVPLPDPAARPRRLAVTPDGTVWYTDYARGYLGALDPATGRVREWRSPGGNAGPYGISIGTDGRIWYCEAKTGSMIAFDPKTQQMTVVPIPTPGAIVRHMVTDTTRGRVWLALSGTGRIGEIELGAPR